MVVCKIEEALNESALICAICEKQSIDVNSNTSIPAAALYMTSNCRKYSVALSNLLPYHEKSDKGQKQGAAGDVS